MYAKIPKLNIKLVLLKYLDGESTHILTTFSVLSIV